MPTNILMPALSPTMEEGTLTKWMVKEGDEVQVSGLAQESKCLREIYVEAEWDGKDITVPLVQLQGIEADGQTQQAVDDWHYWVGRGYGF